MTRIIKFRAWDKKNKIMNGFKNIFEFLSDPLFEEKYIIMQYTGLKDKNGVEIYEGDVVSWKAYNKNNKYDIIEYDDTDASFYLGDWYERDYPEPSVYAEVIGNIYQNPEILKT